MASTLIAPTPITIPFAASGSKNTIPATSQIGVVDGAASYPDGFPPLCGTPLESGGKPPSRADMNGILHGITENLRYLLGGCVPKFNAIFAAAIGGYPVGAIIQDDAGENSYRSLVDGNSTNFNTVPSSIGVSWELEYGPEKSIPNATTSVAGIAKVATSTEAVLGESDAVILTPSKLRSAMNCGGDAPIYAVRAWVNFNGTGTISIKASGNVSSITDLGIGRYRINFATSLQDTFFAVGGASGLSSWDMRYTDKTVSSVDLRIENTREVNLADSPEISCIIVR